MTYLEITVDLYCDCIKLGTPPRLWLNRKKFDAWKRDWKELANYNAKVLDYAGAVFVEPDDPRWDEHEYLLEYEHQDAFRCWLMTHEEEILG